MSETKIERMIDLILENELKGRITDLQRAKEDGQSKEELADYEDDIRNINEAISLWKKVRP